MGWGSGGHGLEAWELERLTSEEPGARGGGRGGGRGHSTYFTCGADSGEQLQLLQLLQREGGCGPSRLGGPALASGSIWVHTQPRHFPVQEALG